MHHIFINSYFLERDDDRRHKATLTQSTIDALIHDIETLVTGEKDSRHRMKFKDISRRVRVCTIEDTEHVGSLLNTILKCLDSKFYLEVFENIELSQSRPAFGAVSTNKTLADKHLFYMRECPEFLFRHDYKNYNDIANTLGKKMLEHTTTIFEKHLPVLFTDQGNDDFNTRIVRHRFLNADYRYRRSVDSKSWGQ